MTTLLSPPVVDGATRREFLAGLTGAGLLTACGAPRPVAPAATTRPFRHDQGTTEVPVDPRRIVTLSPFNGMLALLELGVRPYGSAYTFAPDGRRQFAFTDGYDTTGVEFVTGYPIDLEAVTAAAPDLIVSAGGQEDLYDRLSAIAPTVLINAFDKPLPDALDRYAELVGRPAEGAARRAAYEGRVTALRAAFAPRRGRLSVSVLEAGTDGTFYRGDYGGSIGAVFADLDLLRPPVQRGTPSPDAPAQSAETVGDHDADLVVVFDFASDAGRPSGEVFTAQPVVQELAAARAGQLLVLPGGPVVGSAWGKLDTLLGELERVLLDPALRDDVLTEP